MNLSFARRNRSATNFGLAMSFTPALLATASAVLGFMATAARGDQPEEPKPAPAKPKVGLLVNDEKACKGYTLLAPSFSTTTYLIDMEGRVVQSWKSDCTPGFSAFLLDNGNLLRTGAIPNPPFFGGGSGGRIQEFTWDGKLVWDYSYYNDNELPNHDISRLPNGNVLMIVWEKKLSKDAIAAGRRPETVAKDGYMLSASILQAQPTGKTTGKIVWEWHAWDHLIQDFDETKANYGDVGAHPELIDLNFGDATIAAMVAKPDELKRLRAIGYVGNAGRQGMRPQTDWLHINAVACNAGLDQIMLSVFEFSELWIIDHSTKTTESASHTGGRYGKGGDLLYRWGNPRSYRAGTVRDQKLFGQHDTHWIDKGHPGEGHVLIFNNGLKRTGGAYSTVDEIVPPMDSQGGYEYTPGKPFGPDKAVWSYVARKRIDFYAPFISGAQRLPNGNTLICSGTNGTIFEVTPKGEIVWKYVNPEEIGFPFGGPPGGVPLVGPPKLGEILPSFLQDFMNLRAGQKKEVEATEKELAEKLDQLLTGKQKRDYKEKPGGFADFPPAGRLMSDSVQERLKLTAGQKRQLAEMQKDADARLAKILDDPQKKQLKEMQDFAKAFAAGPPGGGPPGGGPPSGGPPGGFRTGGGPPGGGPGGFPGFGPPGGAGVFRAPRYAPDYPGLAGKELSPGKTIEELQQKDPPTRSPEDAPKEPAER